MYPAGRAGVALICLRLALIVAIFLSIRLEPLLVDSRLAIAAATVLGFLLLTGLATTLSASVSILGAGALVFGSIEQRLLCVVLALLVSISLLLVGPGAYSLDARIFGRREVIFNADEDSL